MLRTYGKQLTNAKRLARFRQTMDDGEPQKDLSRQAKRRELVERIAHEIIENLIVNSDPPPVVKAILAQLEQELGHRYFFEYSLEGGDVQIFEETYRGSQGLDEMERDEVMRRLWEITLSKVDDTML
nr:DVU0524 family FlgM-associated protein [Pseudodesulfovibrio sp. JC047]